MLSHLKTEWLLSTEITSGLLQPARRSASFTVSEHFPPVVYFIPRSNKVLEIVSIPNFCRENNFKRWTTWWRVRLVWMWEFCGSFCNSSGRKFGRKTGNCNICTNISIRLRRGSNGGFSEISSIVYRCETCRLSMRLLASQGWLHWEILISSGNVNSMQVYQLHITLTAGISSLTK
jgi:hypothetical protein